jgi:hypothetical protein
VLKEKGKGLGRHPNFGTANAISRFDVHDVPGNVILGNFKWSFTWKVCKKKPTFLHIGTNASPGIISALHQYTQPF